MHRLKTVTEQNGNQTEYEFDSFGNISKEYTITPGDIKTKYYHYDKANRLLLMYDDKSSAEYTYDAEGNMISKVSDAGGISKSNYVYDGYNRLSEFYSQNTEAQYSYNPEGLRQTKTVNGNTTRFLYSDGNIIGEFTGDDYYIYHRGTELIGCTSFSGKNLTYQQNSHGNVTALLDYDGTEIKTYSYNAYGKEEAFIPNPEGNQTILYQWKNETDSTYNPFRYCGEYVDAETGLVYLRNRYYDPSIGRFITEDPANDGLNWYVYCHNDPINYIDPLGYWEQGDEKYSTTVQTELLKLTVAWYVADNEADKQTIAARADEIRNTFNSGIGKILDVAKSLTGAAADEFSWFLGGDVGRAERDYWLTEAQRYQHNIKVGEKSRFSSLMFGASLASPSPDDAWRMISKKASKEMLETVGEKGAKKFIKSISKYAGSQGTNGIKKLQGSGIKGYMYEVKVKGVGGAYRLLGNKTESGEILWELFEKTH